MRRLNERGEGAKRGTKHTASNKQGESLDRVSMSSLLSLQPVQCLPTDLARLHGRLTVLGQILTRGRVVVDTETHLAGTGAHERVGKDEVGDQVATSIVRGLLSAGSGAEAESGQNGTGRSVSSILLRQYNIQRASSITYDMVAIVCYAA